MIDLLTKPAFQRRALPLAVEAWHEMVAKNMVPKRSELIRGVIVEKMPKSILHVKLVGRVLQLLQSILKANGYWVRKEDPLTLMDSEPEPDISVVVGSESDYSKHPSTALLAVEVSISTLEEDREMALIYAEAGVKEFWIINARQQTLELYQEPSASGYLRRSELHLDQILTSQALPEVSFEIRSLFDGLLPVEG